MSVGAAAPGPRLLADENFPGPAVAYLRSAGRDVVWVAETRPGIADPAVVAWGRSEARVVLTFDRDLAERLVRFRDPLRRGWSCCASCPRPRAARGRRRA